MRIKSVRKRGASLGAFVVIFLRMGTSHSLRKGVALSDSLMAGLIWPAVFYYFSNGFGNAALLQAI
jgi:hypothetical protein